MIVEIVLVPELVAADDQKRDRPRLPQESFEPQRFRADAAERARQTRIEAAIDQRLRIFRGAQGAHLEDLIVVDVRWSITDDPREGAGAAQRGDRGRREKSAQPARVHGPRRSAARTSSSR